MSNSAISGRFSWSAAFTLVAIVAVAAAVFVFLRLETWPARTITQGTADLERLGKDLRSAFVEIAHLEPRITINNRSFAQEISPTTELAVVSREFKVKREFLHTWAGSSKRIKLVGSFTVKAGFDLRREVAVDVRPDEIVVQVPHAQILATEQKRVDVLALDNGLWNRISNVDLQTELAALPQLALKQATESNLPGEAEQELERQLNKRVHARQRLRLVFITPAPSEQTPASEFH
jgi:Protein of unknown function (DUF4230)